MFGRVLVFVLAAVKLVASVQRNGKGGALQTTGVSKGAQNGVSSSMLARRKLTQPFAY